MAGLDFVDEKLLYFRAEAALLWDELDTFQSNEMRGLDIEGCPGAGKSCEVWAWLCSLNSRSQHSARNLALWVRLFRGLSPLCIMFRGSYILRIESLNVSKVKEVMESIECDMIVLDGFRYDSANEEIRSAAFDSKARKIFTVKSMAGKRYVNEDKIKKISSFEVYPWALQQYKSAVADPRFLNSVLPYLDPKEVKELSPEDIPELVERKFYYAGASARWMFTYKIEEVLREIEIKIQQVPDSKVFLSSRVGITNQANSDHLMVRYKSGNLFASFLISKYVTSRLLQICEASVFKIAYSLASENENPSFMEWVVEFDFISQLKASTNSTIKLFTSEASNAEVEWKVPGVIDFDPDTDFDASALPLGMWLKPVKWNQEGYDLVGLFQDAQNDEIPYLRFVQITNAEAHKANLKHFRKLAAKVAGLGLEVGVEIVMISPVGNNPTSVDIKNENLLQEFRIGSTKTKWSSTSVRPSIVQYFFKKQHNSR